MNVLNHKSSDGIGKLNMSPVLQLNHTGGFITIKAHARAAFTFLDTYKLLLSIFISFFFLFFFFN